MTGSKVSRCLSPFFSAPAIDKFFPAGRLIGGFVKRFSDRWTTKQIRSFSDHGKGLQDSGFRIQEMNIVRTNPCGKVQADIDGRISNLSGLRTRSSRHEVNCLSVQRAMNSNSQRSESSEALGAGPSRPSSGPTGRSFVFDSAGFWKSDD